MTDLSILFYDCGCVIRLNMKRKLDSATLCDRHHNELLLAEKTNKILQEPILEKKK